MLRLVATILLAIDLAACSSVPSKVPELLDKTANGIDTQALLVKHEWNSSITSNDSALKLLEMIYPVIKKVDQSQLDAEGKANIAGFLKAYPIVQKQLEDSVSQKEGPDNANSNFGKLSNSVRFANTYISKSVDENKRVESAIEDVKNLRDIIQQKGGSK